MRSYYIINRKYLVDLSKKIRYNKKTIKYELIINKALRSALEYDKPDEQINELQQVDMDIIVLRLGGAFSREDEALTFDQLYRNADSAMYHSKKIPGCHATIYNEKLEVK